MASKIATSDKIELSDGRTVRVLSYEDGAIRVRVDGAPFYLEECFLTGGSNGQGIVKLVPRTR